MRYLELRKLKKAYQGKPILSGVDFSASKGEFLAIMGRSGSGKSTLLHLMAGIEKIDSGDYFLDGVNLAGVSEKKFAKLRNREIGYILQSYALIPNMTVYQNIMLPLQLRKNFGTVTEQYLEHLAKRLKVTELLNKRVSKLSGGEKQRVAIARALIIKPKVILADEVTGALDEETAREVMQLLVQLSKEGNTIIMVTHNRWIAEYADRILYLENGILRVKE